jgi:Mn2+/Fe2+ NRAMP family transporter
LTCAEIARVTGKGLASNIKTSFPIGIVRAVVVLLLVANILNIASDLAVMGEVAALVTGIGRHWLAIGFAAVSLALQVWVPYHRYVGLLKWLTLALFAYVGVVLTVGLSPAEVIRAIIHPTLKLDIATATMVVAILGTTISPYLFFWQSAQELEEMGVHHSKALKHFRRTAGPELHRMQFDSWSGMALTHVISLSIMLSTAATLHAHGLTRIDSASQAALALKPFAGDFAFALFAIGIIGTGMLAVPVLAGSAAYALSETMGWRAGLELKPKQARGFYGIIAAAVVAAMLLNFSGVNPITALFWTAVVNGVVAVPLMVVIMVLATRRATMGDFALTGWQARFGWAATALMAIAAVVMFATL